MNKLMVLIIISIGIRELGVPRGRKWANGAFSSWHNPRITALVQRGIAIPRFVESCVVGVNVCGSSPRRFVEPMNIIRDTDIKDHVCPLDE